MTIKSLKLIEPSIFEQKFLNWYRGTNVLKLDYNDNYTESFVSQVVGFFIQVVDDEELSPKVYFTETCESAAVDIEKKEIWLSTNYLRLKEPKVDIFHTIFFYNGMIIHELGHLKYTKIAIEKIVKFAPEFDHQNMYMNSIYQIVEDLFIDNVNIQQFERFSDFNLARFQYLFSSKEFEERKANLPTNIKTAEDFQHYINALVMLKNPENRSKKSTETFKQLEALFLRGLSMADQIERVSLAVEIYKTIFNSLLVNEQEKLDNEVKELKGFEDSANELQKLLEQLLEGDGLLGADNSNLSTNPNTQLQGYASTKVVGGFGSEYYGPTTPFKIIIDVDANHQNVSNIIHEVKPKKDHDWEMSTNWDEMIKLMKAKSQVNRYYGLQNNFGKKMRQVHRIATDGKVFADPIVTNGLGPQEVIILVDMSGSMSTNNNFVTALSEAWGLATILESGRHKVSVFGHTADMEFHSYISGSTVSCVLYKFKDFEERASVIEERLQLVNTKHLGNNMDHMAIEMVAETFTKANNKKSLIVISDGFPASRFYECNAQAISLTKDKAQSLREKGVNVFSLSIDKSCVDANDEIYGESHNFFCKANNIAKQVVEYMTKG